MTSIKNKRASRMKDKINGTYLVAMIMVASLLLLGTGYVVASTEPATTCQYLDEFPERDIQDEPIDGKVSPKPSAPEYPVPSGYSSGVSHV